MSSEYEHHLKEWWTDSREEDLYQWFCVHKLKVCCPSKHYGPDCLPCKGYPNVCNSHGLCKVIIIVIITFFFIIHFYGFIYCITG